MKFASLVFKFGLIFRNLLLYLGLPGFIFPKSHFAGSQRLVNFFQLRLILEYLRFQFPYHGLESLDSLFSLFCLFGQFADIIALMQMLHITPINTVPTFKTIFTTDIFIQGSVHLFQYTTIFKPVFPKLCRPHHTLASAFGTDADRNNQGMDMRAALVKVYLKPDNVFLPVSVGAPVIDVLRPMFNFLAPI